MAKKILIAEDERPIAKAIELKLKGAGYEAVVVNDGEAALRILEEQKFDLIMLDLVMPKKTGFDVLEDLKEKGDKTPVIVTSNLSQEEDLKKSKELGVVDYFVKSDTPLVEIIQKVSNYLK